MLSRVADSIYWMGRYVERAENVARIVDVNLQLMMDSPDYTGQQWEPLVNISGDHEDFAKRFGNAASQENVLKFLAFDYENPNSIVSCLRAARHNARSVREIISSEMWLQLNKFYLTVDAVARQVPELDALHGFFDEVKSSSHLFNGVAEATMTHGEGWHFCRLGKQLERADKTSRILDVKYFILLRSVTDVGTAWDDIQWAAVLRSTSAFEMYRKEHGRITPKGVVDFLLLNRCFPRAIYYCLLSARDSHHAISGTPIGSFKNPAEKFVGQLCSELSYATVDEVIAFGLHEYIDDLQIKINSIGEEVFETFLARKAAPVRQPIGMSQFQTQFS
jgi:uncharacterized alpha-E superfamily protein